MQLMPETAREMGVRDPFDPEENIMGGTRYLSLLLNRFGGDLKSALAAYNAGPSAVEKHRGLPPFRETEDYVARVLSLYSSWDK
jgi:soluble lytic murein transglycosylase-like protein